jgi:hypothetical protein
MGEVGDNRGSLEVTRRVPAIVRGASISVGVVSGGGGLWEGATGVSDSLSRLFVGVGLGFGSGRSPTHANSTSMSLVERKDFRTKQGITRRM